MKLHAVAQELRDGKKITWIDVMGDDGFVKSLDPLNSEQARNIGNALIEFANEMQNE